MLSLIKRCWVYGIAMAMMLCAVSAQATDVPAAKAISVKALVKKVFPQVNIDRVLSTPSPNIFIAVNGVQMVYVDPAHQLLFLGSLIDVAHQRDLTEYNKRMIVQSILKEADLSAALKEVHGQGTHTIYVFEDPYCKYCRQLIHQLELIKDVTIYTFITPILKPKSYEMAHKIVCHTDPLMTWKNWMMRYEDPKETAPGTACMMDGLKKNLLLAERLGVSSVPMMVLPSGEMVSGVLSAAEIQEHLSDTTRA